jgi:hypothetical protein
VGRVGLGDGEEGDAERGDGARGGSPRRLGRLGGFPFRRCGRGRARRRRRPDSTSSRRPPGSLPTATGHGK